MESNKILTFEDNPYARMYHYVAFFLGIIQANAKTDITPWLCGKYINCDFRGTYRINKFNYEIFDYWGQDEGVLIRQSMEMSKPLADIVGLEPIGLFRSVLDAGRYVYGIFNERCIPGKQRYEGGHSADDFLLVGYDDRECVFHSVGYLAENIYAKFDVSYDNMRRALETLQSPQYIFYGLGVNPEFDFSLNLPRIAQETENYLSSVHGQRETKPDACYGMSAVETLAAYYENATENAEPIPYPYTRAFMEHKRFWIMCLSYLKKIGISIDDACLKAATEVYDLSQRLHGTETAQFDRLTKDTIRQIAQGIRESASVEQEYLPKVVEILQKEAASV